MNSLKLRARKLTPAIGAILEGIDLSLTLSNEDHDEIYNALIEHQVVFFTDQTISPENQLALARSFGDPQPPHPVYPHHELHENIVILKNGPDNPPDTDGWHTDLSFQQNPPFASVLVARTVPECGGDTLWLSLARAWETLAAGIQSELEELTAVHDMGDFRNNFANMKGDASELIKAHQRFGSAIHPVVQTHPVSGRKYLYVNEGFTQHIVGMRATESNRMLDFLYHHISQPENQVRFHWTPGAMAIWDNRCTWHYATADYLPNRREMHRVTVINDARVDSNSG